MTKGSDMQLMKYVKGTRIMVNFGDEKLGSIEYTAQFSPEAEIPDEYVQRLLDRHPDDFVKVQSGPTICGKCGREFKNERGVVIHTKRIHKEVTS